MLKMVMQILLTVYNFFQIWQNRNICSTKLHYLSDITFAVCQLGSISITFLFRVVDAATSVPGSPSSTVSSIVDENKANQKETEPKGVELAEADAISVKV